MNSTILFCPECGEPMLEEVNCRNCGFDSKSPSKELPIMQEKRLKLWKKIKSPVKFIGTYSWLITTIVAFIFLIIGFIRIFSRGSFWSFIFWGIAFGLSLYYLKPYSEKYKEEQWYYILNDVWVLGNLRLPKLLVLTVVIDILLLGYGGLFSLIPILIVIFLGPLPMNWLINTIFGAPKPPKAPKIKKEKNRAPIKQTKENPTTDAKESGEDETKPKSPKNKALPSEKTVESKAKETKDEDESDSSSPEKTALYEKYATETGKKAIWREKETKAYIDWESAQNEKAD